MMVSITRAVTRTLVAAALGALVQAPAQAETILLPGTSLHATGTEIFVEFIGASGDHTKFAVLLSGVGQIFKNSAQPGHQRVISGLYEGQELVFGIHVKHPSLGKHRYWMGDGSLNTDGQVHARLVRTDHGTIRIEFEDGFGSQDFDDVIIEVGGVSAAVTPEPVTMVLLGSGLIGLAGVGARRRHRLTGAT